MERNLIKKIIYLLLIYFAVECFSLVAFSSFLTSQIIFIILALGALGLTLYRLEYGMLAVLAELLIGSMGHLFNFNLYGYSISVRIMIYSVVLGVYLISLAIGLIKSGKKDEYWLSLKEFSGSKYFIIFFAFLIVGLINGFIHHHSLALIFSDFNAWLYFLLLGPALAVYRELTPEKISRLKIVFLSAAIWLSFKTLILLYIFTHDLAIASGIYLWLRNTLVGEMTPTSTGWPRIFIQGQVFSAIAYFFIFLYQVLSLRTKHIFKNGQLINLILGALFLSAILLSFSRSFWLALLISSVLSLIFIWQKYSFKKLFEAAVWLFLSAVFSFCLIYLIIAFPYWRQAGQANIGSSFLNRVNSGNESAISSRWSLLPVLIKEIKKEPFFGQGYGAEVTYISSDPRVLEKNKSGEYTTYAFEWAYLDTWLKIGFLGLFSYFLIIFFLLKNNYQAFLLSGNYYWLAPGVSIIFLMVTNIFTPYLNHPLGIGFLVIASCLIWRDKVY